MGFRINGGSYSALTKALGIRGQSQIRLLPSAITRYAPAAAGQLSFVEAPYSGYEGNALSFSVARNGGASGTVAVDWAITVSEGAPTPAAGTISWNAGEAGLKTVSVQAGLVTADRTATITLSNPRAVGGGTAPTISGSATATALIRNDITAPTVPTLGAPTLTGSSAVVPLDVPSTDAQSGLARYSLEQASGGGAFSEIASGLSIFPRTVTGLNLPATTYGFRARARDAAGNNSAYSPTVQVTTPDVVVALTSWAQLNLAANPVSALDFAARDYPIWTPNNGAYHTYFGAGGWDNGPRVRIMGSQVEQTACGLGNFVNLWRNGTLAIRKLNLRLQLLFGPTLVQNWSGADWKFIIVQTSPTLLNSADPGGGERPMLRFNWNSGVNQAGMGPKKLGLGASCSTFGNFVRTPPYERQFGTTRDSDWFMGTAGATVFDNRPVVGPLEWINLEMECISESTADAPSGRIRYVVTRRNGQVFDLPINWNYDSNWTVGDYIHGVQLIGGYWNQAVTASDAGTYYEMQNLVLAANQPGLLGAPAGFITG